ncbi:hypothetical protein [Actinosynnema sp. ALI-1.44]|uniref:hypothetical protein n=1 Tax=Actinosynnema sp. ALI-1.44 TaxID=1933779 RepID=UPI0011777644|nr:hypothetical protein [Actinosynnema sp. ALI-1.44]
MLRERKGFVAHDLPDGQAFATTEVTVMRPSARVEVDYLGWTLQSSQFLKKGESYMTGSGGLRRVPDSFVGSFSIPIPDCRTQRAVAGFLDRETARIDTLIEEQQRLIAMLVSRKSAVVDAVITRGIDADSRLVDSGVDWIGPIPRRVGHSPIVVDVPPDQGCQPPGGANALRLP